ncbi:MAG: ABC transporter ATP-binding protein [Anaerolineales bacterium]|nr:ABC transporter ATP-binding protein [Anaerolineales bacterium]
MTLPAIHAVGIGKHFELGVSRQKYGLLRDALTAQARLLGERLRGRRPAAAEAETFWALRDVNFEIQPGEVVGIIGRNGAGKSTLLKILSRITEPNTGYVDVRGRVGSLLEVGTGFHPELTGRENIFLNGSILGMRRAEIARKFDEIVAFAEVEKFLDTPVKHYSSGMHMRLAFAVAAHLEPEILLVDEVLAVGDNSFQKKCLNKMEDVGQRGRTILFVSHSMPAITRLCPRTILLHDGQVLQDGPSHAVISTYLSSGLGTTAAREWPDLRHAPGDDVVRLRAVRIRDQAGQIADVVDIRQPVAVELEFEVFQSGYALWPHFTLYNDEGVFVLSAFDLDPEWHGRPRPAGRYLATAEIPGNLLAEGMMLIGPAMATIEPRRIFFYERDAVAFQVVDNVSGESSRGRYVGHIPGAVRPKLKWATRYSRNGHDLAGPAAAAALNGKGGQP